MVGPTAIRQALYQCLNHASVTTLLASGSASLLHEVAPPNTAYPFVIFGKQSGVPTNVFGEVGYESHLWLVKAVDRNSSSTRAEAIMDVVEDRLSFADFAISGGSLMYLARSSDIDYVETEGDQIFRHHGALYRVLVQE